MEQGINALRKLGVTAGLGAQLADVFADKGDPKARLHSVVGPSSMNVAFVGVLGAPPSDMLNQINFIHLVPSLASAA